MVSITDNFRASNNLKILPTVIAGRVSCIGAHHQNWLGASRYLGLYPTLTSLLGLFSVLRIGYARQTFYPDSSKKVSKTAQQIC